MRMPPTQCRLVPVGADVAAAHRPSPSCADVAEYGRTCPRPSGSASPGSRPCRARCRAGRRISSRSSESRRASCRRAGTVCSTPEYPMSTCRVCNRGWDDGTDPAVPCGALRRKQYCRVLIVPHGMPSASLPPPARADRAWLPRRGCRSCAQNRRAILRCRRAAVRYLSACSNRPRQCWRSLQNESGCSEYSTSAGAGGCQPCLCACARPQ